MFSKTVFKQTAQTSALALAIALATGSAAKADYPGEVWSVDALTVKSSVTATSGLSKSKLRMGLQRANDVYFYGEKSLRMIAEVLSGDAAMMQLTLVEQSSGEVLARSPKIAVSKDGGSVEAKALAWMEGLNCVAAGCASAPEVQQPVRIAKGRLDVGPVISHHGSAVSAESGTSGFGVPVPVSRPVPGSSSGKRGKARIYPSGLSAKDLSAAVSSLQIAWAIPREVGALTYSDADQLVLEDAVQLARATPAAAVPVRPVRVPTTPKQEESTLLGRWLTRVAEFLAPEPEQETVQTAATVPAISEPTVSATPSANDVVVPTAEPTIGSIVQPPKPTSAWTRASDAVTLINPIDRFRTDTTIRGVSDGERIAVADLRARITDPANVRSTQLLGQSGDTRELLQPNSRGDDILVAVAQPTRTTPTNLSIKLHPEVLGRYSASALAGLTPRRNNRLKKAPAVAARAPSDAVNLNAILKERGLELNLAGYNRFERVYWGGTGDEGFWISLPNRVNAKFVLVSGPTSSVIAAVRRRNGIARASQGVAEALELRPREWSKLRVISLRPDNQSAALPFLVWSNVLKGRDVLQ